MVISGLVCVDAFNFLKVLLNDIQHVQDIVCTGMFIIDLYIILMMSIAEISKFEVITDNKNE